jgi:hypothetical protein
LAAFSKASRLHKLTPPKTWGAKFNNVFKQMFGVTKQRRGRSNKEKTSFSSLLRGAKRLLENYSVDRNHQRLCRHNLPASMPNACAFTSKKPTATGSRAFLRCVVTLDASTGPRQ